MVHVVRGIVGALSEGRGQLATLVLTTAPQPESHKVVESSETNVTLRVKYPQLKTTFFNEVLENKKNKSNSKLEAIETHKGEGQFTEVRPPAADGKDSPRAKQSHRNPIWHCRKHAEVACAPQNGAKQKRLQKSERG